ncbi:AAA family ATPase [Klebsiella pneumoniae]
MSQYSQFSVSKVFGMPSIPEKVTAIGYADGSNPFIPATDTNYVFRKEFLREVLAYLKEPGGDALFVTGPTGSGKTSGITEIAGRLNWPVQQITAHGRMELTDLIGHHALVAEKPGQPPVMKFMRGAPPNYLECIMEKHNLKSGFSIYFADVHFEKQVYAFGSGLGFTSVIYAYSLGRDPEEAEKLALEKYDSDETKVKKVHVNLARSQDINRYTFPEQMAGFANAIQSHGIAVN